MPRPTKRVKTFGAVDLHFHGAFGIDLMSAPPNELDRLSGELKTRGVAAFCATTLSAAEAPLAETVARLGKWIASGSAPGAQPLGIHLEGPFLSPDAAGAHPEGVLRKFSMTELEKLWQLSKKTLRILTLAPETLDPAGRKELGIWASKRKVRLSIGHTRCTAAQAEAAFGDGFTGVTHAWNALSYHHREPGVLGAAFGRDETYIELILDEVHVAAPIIDWTLALHPQGTFFVSDAAPAAATDGSHFHSFGELECRLQDHACRLPNGTLAGGGLLLPEAFAEWVGRESIRKKTAPEKLLRTHLSRVHELPLAALFIKKSSARSLLKKFPVTYEIVPGTRVSPPQIRVATKSRR